MSTKTDHLARECLTAGLGTLCTARDLIELGYVHGSFDKNDEDTIEGAIGLLHSAILRLAPIARRDEDGGAA